ncbi:MAG: hypothetical protein FJX76_13725 [Armatimonadetes bacterium]|nr:hypothetical protein [Armatimonadota bacterium]
MTEFHLAYRYEPGEDYVSALSLKTESRAGFGQGRGDAASERLLILRTRVLRVVNGAARLEITVEGVRGEDAPLQQGDRHECEITPQGRISDVPPDAVLPGAWYPLPPAPVPLGGSWRAQARPHQFPMDATVIYVLRKVSLVKGRLTGTIEWDCPTMTLPTESGRREFHGWGSYQIDLDRGRLVWGRGMTRTKHSGTGWETDAITQLDLEDLTDTPPEQYPLK